VTEQLVWTWQGTAVPVGISRLGSGPTILLLPALSSISTRAEMAPLQALLASRFSAVAVDWPGFGMGPSPRIRWHPQVYAAFLRDLLAGLIERPVATIGAGHGAGYLLGQAAEAPGSAGLVCLVAPTWRGPLPTMLGRRHPAMAALASAGDVPVLGWPLYRLNVNRLTVGMMSRGHVYADPGWLTGARLAAKLAVTRTPGARHASLRFVAGALDPMRSRDEFIAVASRVRDPVVAIFGADTPRKSLAEIEALCAIPHVQAVRLPRGKLALHEEFPADVMAAVAPLLGGGQETVGAEENRIAKRMSG
jgi:pimeloyl-ACP methyl ester carboxylesterase